MSATYRSSSATTANTGATPASSLTINTASGFQSNDILIACISVSGGSGASITAPSGWALIGGTNETTDILTRAYWRQATGYELASYAWTFDTTRQASGVMVAYFGAYPYMPRTFTTAINSAASTTTASGTGNSTYETGLSIQVFGAYNTSSATTMTATGGYAQRADTCTSASSFVEVAIQDISKGTPLGGMAANAATISSAATSTSINFMLEDLRTLNALVEDETLVGNKTSSFSSFATGTFAVNYPNEVLLVFGSIAKDTNTISSITGGGLTWVNAGRANTNAGSTEVWRAFAPVPQTFALTMTMSASTVSFSYTVVGIIGADMSGANGSGAIGAFGTAASTSAAPTVSITTTRNNSWVWGAGNDPANAGGATSAVAGTNQLLLRNSKDTTVNACSGWAQRQTALTPVSGTSVTINNTAPSTDSCNILAVEILPAIHYNLAATGAG